MSSAKTLKERATGRTKNIILDCVRAAINSPGTEIHCFDHDHANQEQHLHVASVGSKILKDLDIPHTLEGNVIKVLPYKKAA